VTNQKMLNQEVYFPMCFFLAFSGCKLTKAAGLPRLQGRKLSLVPESV